MASLHVPFTPPVRIAAQAWQAPSQALSQQKPSTQKPLSHCAAAVQGELWIALPPIPPELEESTEVVVVAPPAPEDVDEAPVAVPPCPHPERTHAATPPRKPSCRERRRRAASSKSKAKAHELAPRGPLAGSEQPPPCALPFGAGGATQRPVGSQTFGVAQSLIDEQPERHVPPEHRYGLQVLAWP
jgi:hypothetical protein